MNGRNTFGVKMMKPKNKTKKKDVFDFILKKDNYTKEEVREILLGTYEGFTDFTDGFLKAMKKKVACNFRDDGDCIIKLSQNYHGVSQKCVNL